MVTLADYEAFKRKEKAAGAGAAGIVLGQEFAGTPDEAAGDLNLAAEHAKATGAPVAPSAMVKEYRGLFQRNLDTLKAGTILSSSPTLSAWLREPDNAAVSRDDLENLSWFEQQGRGLVNAVDRGVKQIQLGMDQSAANSLAQRAADRGRSFDEILQDESKKSVAGLSLIFAGWRQSTAMLDAAFGNDTEGKAAFMQQRAAEMQAKIAEIPKSPNAKAIDDWMTAMDWSSPDALSTVLQNVALNPIGFAEWVTQTGAEVAPQIAAATAVTAATRNPTAGAAVFGGSSYLVNSGAQSLEFVQEAGYDLATPAGALAAIKDRKLMASAAARGQAYGLVVGAMDTLSGGLAAKELAKSPAANLFLQTLLQSGLAGTGELSGQVVASMPIDPASIFGEMLAEVGSAPAEVAGIGGRAFLDKQARAKASEDRVNMFKAISGQAVASKLRERMPDKFRQFIERATADGPVENVFVPADKFVEYFQSKGLDPAKVLENLPGVTAADLDMALETGGDLKIPTASYAASIAGSNHDAWMIENMRLNPGEWTSEQSKQFELDKADLMLEAQALADQMLAEEEELRSVEQEIYDTMVSRLRLAGRATDVATTEAMLYPAFYRTMAERSGLSTEEFLARYPLPRIEGAAPAGMQLKDVTALKRTLAEARTRRAAPVEKGMSLLEFIDNNGGVIDAGGDIAAMDAATIKRGKGKKTLRIVRKANPLAGMASMLGVGKADTKGGLDDMARAAYEAGYMANDPRVMAHHQAIQSGGEAVDLIPALLDAIRSEMAGVRDHGGNVTAADATDGIDALEEYLSGLGVSLDNTDEEIRAAMERGQSQAGDGVMYAQAELANDLAVWRGKLKDFLTGKLRPSADLRVGKTPAVLRALGVPTRQVVFRAGKVRKVMVDHPDIGNSSLLDLPAMLADPQLVYEEVGKESDFVVVTDKKSATGSPVVVAIKAEGVTNGAPATIVLTVYPLDGGNTKLASVMTDGRMRYIRDGKAAAEYELTGANSLKGSPKQSPGQRPSRKILSAADVFKGGAFNQPADGSGFGNGAGLGASPRGMIQFPAAGVGNGETIISTFAGADLSTVLHESGHYFLTVFRDMAIKDPTGPMGKDFDAIKDWWHENAAEVARDANAAVQGVTVTADDVRLALDAGTSGDALKDQMINVGMQEQFARGVEAYLMEGKAPSIGLRSAFEKFRAWLISIYRRALGLNVAISDEMRGVFDRLLATDQEIAEAKQQSGATDPIFATAEEMGLSPEDYAKFRRLYEQANDEAAAATLDRIMAPIRRAKTAIYKAERKAVVADVTAALQNEPVYRAIQELRFGKGYDGEDVPAVKLSRQAIEKDYGPGHIGFLPGATKDGKGHRNAVFSDEGGVHPDVAAGMYGFASGEAFLDALEKAPDLKDAIEAEVEKEMAARHSDPMTDGSVQRVALQATHSDKRGQVLAAELKALNDVAGYDRGLTFKEARETARRTLRGLPVRDAVRSDRFLAAERKAGEQAFTLGRAVTREGLWMDAARRKVAKAVSATLRAEDGALALGVNAATDKANENTLRNNQKVADLIEAKRRQLLNHMLYDESRKVADGVEALVKKAGKLNKSDAKLAKARNIDYVRAARAIAAKFGLARPESDFDFGVWIEQLRVDDAITADALTTAIATYTQDAKPYKDMTVAELGALADAIESVLEVGKRARLLEVDGQAVDRELAISELRDVLDQRPQSENKALSAKLSKADKVKVAALSIVSSLRRMEAWARDMDDGEAGVFTRYLVKPVMDAVGIYREDKAERLRALLAIIEPRKADLLGKAINAPELGYTFENKGEFLHALLHTGNESNLEKLLLGRGWSSGLTGQVQRMTPGGKPSVDRQGNPLMTRGRVDTSKWDALVARLISEGALTKEDYETAQAIWNLMDTIKRPAQSAHRKVYGYYFQEVEPSPLVTPFGTFRGGYVPAIADGDASNDGQIRADQAALEAQQTSFMFPTTGAGFTKARVQNYTTPLSLNLMLLPAHMDKVLRFTHLNPVIRQTASLVNSRELRAAIDAVDKTILPNLVTPWLQRTAQQAVEAQPTTPAGRAASNVFRDLRKRVGVHTMFLNLVNTAQQVTGFSSAAVLVKPARLKSALARFAKGGAGDMRAEASAASLFMRDRIENSVRELNGRIQEAIVKPTIAGGLDAWVQRHGYVLQQGTQNVIDVIAWHAAYDQAIGKGASDSDAVFEADSVIRRTMGDFSPENLSMFETGSAFTRLFTMFYSYFNGQANLVGGEMQTAMRTMGWSGAGRMFFIYLFGIAIPAIVGNAIVKAAGGGLDDDEEDGYLDELLEMFFGSQLSYVAGMIPGGSVPMTMLNRFNGQFYDDRISTSPVVSAVERAVSAPGSAWKAAAGDGSARKAVTDGLTALGLVTGIPMGQLAKMAGYATGVAEGSSRPDDLGDVMRGLASGRDGSEN